MKRLVRNADLATDKNTAQTVLNNISQLGQTIQNLSQQMDSTFNGVKSLLYDQNSTTAKAPFDQWQQETDADWKEMSDAWNSFTSLNSSFDDIIQKVTATCNAVINQQDNTQPPTGF